MNSLGKMLVFVLVLGVGAYAMELPEDLTGRAMERAKEVDSACRAETNAGEEVFMEFILGDETDEDHVYKCYVKCVMMKLHAMDADGNFRFEEELLNVPPEIEVEGHALVNKCKGVEKRPDPCETAYKIHMCYLRENRELFLHAIAMWFEKAAS